MEIPPDKARGSLEDLDTSLTGGNLSKTPVTLNDPLGALSSQTSPMDTPAKEKSVGIVLIMRTCLCLKIY